MAKCQSLPVKTVHGKVSLVPAVDVILNHELKSVVSYKHDLPSEKLQEQKSDRICTFPLGATMHIQRSWDQWDHRGFQKDAASYASLLRRCANVKALSQGRRLHKQIMLSGLWQNNFLANILLQMYGNCGALEDSRALFASMQPRDRFSWNFMISAHTLHGQGKKAFLLFEQMQGEGIIADPHIFCSILSACASDKNLAKGKQMHTRIVGNGLESDEVVGGNLVNMYGKCGIIEVAQAIFDKMAERSAVAWTAMIVANVQYGRHKDALLLFNEMQLNGMKLDRVASISILSACTSKEALTAGRWIHDCILENNLGSDVVVANALVNMYGKCGSLEHAWRVFDQMSERDILSWTGMITLLAQSEQGHIALELFNQMQQQGFLPNEVTFTNILCACAGQEYLAEGKQLHAAIVSYGFETDVIVGTSLVNMYSKCGSLEDALAVFDRMPLQDEVAIVSVLSACANHEALEIGRKIHACIMSSGMQSYNNVGVSLVTMYGKCGSVDEARIIFDNMSRQDAILWNTMLTAYAQNGQGKEAIDLFQQMQQEEVKPDNATFISLLTACSHTGLADDAQSCLTSLTQDYGMEPVVDHHNCIVDLFARAGQLDEAENMINNMPLQPTVVSWLTLLSACRTQVDVERGEGIAEHVFELDQENTAPYVMLSNIYCAAGRAEDAENLIKVMNDKGLNILSSYSSVDTFLYEIE